MDIIYTKEHRIPENILALRKRHHLSRKALASLLGVSAYWIKGLEEGRFPGVLPDHMLHRLCQIFDVEPEAIIDFSKTS